MAGRADAYRRRAPADRGLVRAGLRRDLHVLAEPRVVLHRDVPLAPRRDADADPRRPLARSAQHSRRPADGRGPDAERRRAAGRLARAFSRSLFRLGPKSGREPELAPGVPTIARMLRARGYEVVLKGKWHLSKALSESGFGPADGERLERAHGFAGWEPPDAG